MSIWKYKYDRGVDASALKVTITVEGRHGVIGLAGIAPASGFEDGIINTSGDLKAQDGSDYITGAARPGIDPVPDYYRLTVRKNGLPISSVVFQPVLATVGATELDINALVRIGKASSATPEQLIALGAGLADLNTKSARADADHAARLQSLADSAQSEAQRIAQQQSNNAQAAGILGRLSAASVATIGAAAGVYNITVGSEAGQVWERTGVGVTPVRRTDLEAESRNQAAILALGTGKTSADVSAVGGLQTKFAGRIRDYGVIPNDPTKAAWNTGIIQAALTLWAGKNLIFGGALGGDGVATYYVTQGFLISDYTVITCETPTRLKIVDGTPARTSEPTQTAFFQGKNATSYSATQGMYGVEIYDLQLDTNQPNSKNALLGNIRFIGAQGCKLVRVKCTNLPTQDQTGLFSILFRATATTPDLCSNLIDDCDVTQTAEWYTDVDPITGKGSNIQANNLTCIGFASLSGSQANGAYDDFTRAGANYIVSRNYNNVIRNCRTSGGTHGYSLDNGKKNTIQGNYAKGHSHRAIILSPTCDDNNILDNTGEDLGSTGIHLANDCRGNTVRGNTIRGVRGGGEGDGIKAYVGCSGNIIEGNHVYDASKQAFRLAHGCNLNTIRGNHAYWTKGRGTPGSAEETAWMTARGYVLMGPTVLQGSIGGLSRVLCLSNQVHSNVAVGFYRGYVLEADPAQQNNAVTNNSLIGNHAESCGIGYYVDPALSSNKLNNNTFFGNTTKGNDADYSSNFADYFSKVAASTNLTDKPAPPAAPSTAPATPFTITPVATGGSIGGTITGLSANVGSTTGNRRRYYVIYTFTPSVGNTFGDQTITPATGFTCEIQSPTALKISTGAPTYVTLMTATSLRVDANSGAVQVRLTADLIG